MGRVENKNMELNICDIINAPSEILISGNNLSVEQTWDTAAKKPLIAINLPHTTTTITINF